MNNHQGTSLNKALLPRLLRLELFPFMDNGCHFAHWDFQCCRIVPFPRIVPRYSPFSEACEKVLGLHVLVCVSPRAIGPYIDKCVVFQSMSSQLNLSQVDSTNVGEISSCSSVGKQMHLSSILSNMAKAVNTYVHVIFLFLFLIHFKQTFFRFVW